MSPATSFHTGNYLANTDIVVVLYAYGWILALVGLGYDELCLVPGGEDLIRHGRRMVIE